MGLIGSKLERGEGTEVERFHRGQHIYLELKNYNQAGTLTACDTGYPKVTIYKPDETKVVDAQAMTSVSTGIYKYDLWQLPADAPFGWWPVQYECVTGGKVTKRHNGFEII